MNREEFVNQLQENVVNDIEIVKRKNSDYANNHDPFQNFRMVQHIGLCSVEEGIVVRMSDKMQRIANLLNRDAVVCDESIIDTLSDLRNYANILQVFLSHKDD